jgi:hypothetical protein
VTFALWCLAVALAPGMPRADLLEVVDDVRAVALDEVPLFEGDDARERTALLLLAWSWGESRWNAKAVGDSGRSLGVMQVNRMWLRGTPPADVLASRRVGLSLGLAHMRDSVAACGSIARGLGAYAGGRCWMAPRLVAARCSQIGGCE